MVPGGGALNESMVSVRRLGPELTSMRQWRVQPDVVLEFFLSNLSTSYIAYLLSSYRG